MTQQQWLDRLSAGLSEQGLPSDYVGRCVTEMQEHLIEGDGDCVRMGNPDYLAASFVSTYRSAKLHRSLPAGVWCVLTMPLAVFSTLAYYAMIGVLFNELERQFPMVGTNESLQPILIWCYIVGKLAAPAIACFVMLRVLADIGRPKWVSAAVLVFLSVSFLFVQSELEMVSIEDVDLSLGISPAGLLNRWQLLGQASQASVVAALGMFSLRRNARAI